jgi:hypothetical protein
MRFLESKRIAMKDRVTRDIGVEVRAALEANGVLV